MAYTTIRLSQAQAALGARLGDPTFVHWTVPETTAYLVEALRTWNAMTGCFHDEGVFSTAFGYDFWDLPALFPALRPYTVTDVQMLSVMEYHLLEAQSSGQVWNGSPQFALTDLALAMQRRRDQFLVETGAVLTRSFLPISPPPNGRVSVPDSIESISRVAWKATDNTYAVLKRDDEWGLSHFSRSWIQHPGRPPRAYSVGVTPPLTIQLFPPPFDTGTLDMITVSRGPALDQANGSTLGIPDDWSWVVKFGALADLLSQDGLALDMGRATYCEARWRHGIQLAKNAAVVLDARILNASCPIASLADADLYRSSWQTTLGPPQLILLAGQNLVAVSPPSDTPANFPSYSVTLDVVRNAIVPVSDSDYLQISSDTFDVILDYAQHLALFKEGAGQLQASQPLLDRFMRASGVTLGLENASSPNRGSLGGQTLQDDRVSPRQIPVEANT